MHFYDIHLRFLPLSPCQLPNSLAPRLSFWYRNPFTPVSVVHIVLVWAIHWTVINQSTKNHTSQKIVSLSIPWKPSMVCSSSVRGGNSWNTSFSELQRWLSWSYAGNHSCKLTNTVILWCLALVLPNLWFLQSSCPSSRMVPKPWWGGDTLYCSLLPFISLFPYLSPPLRGLLPHAKHCLLPREGHKTESDWGKNN